MAIGAMLVAVLVACTTGGTSESTGGDSTPSVGGSSTTTGGNEVPAVRVGFASQPLARSGNSILAFESTDFVNADLAFFQSSELAVQGLLLDEIDVLHIGANGPITATAQGADLVIFAVTIGNDWALVGNDTASSLDDLPGTRVAVHSETSTATVMLRQTLSDEGMTEDDIDLLFIQGSPNRAQALSQGEIDATALFVSEAIQLLTTRPGEFHILLDYGNVPLAAGVLAAKRDWYEANLDAAAALVQAIQAQNSSFADDPENAKQVINERFPDEGEEYVSALVDEYVSRGLWPPDAGAALLSDFGPAIQVIAGSGSLAEGASVDPDDYVDLRAFEHPGS